MAHITKDKVKEIIANSPPGTTPEGIVASLRERGHTLEGYPGTEKKTTLKSSGSFLGTIWEAFKQTAKAPQAMLTEAAKGAGETISDIARGEFGEAKQSLLETGERIMGVRSQTSEEMTTPSRELGIEGVPAFLLDAWSDPLNLLDVGLSKAGKLDDVVDLTKGSKILSRITEKIYQNVLGTTGKKEKAVFKTIGKAIEKQTIGKRLAQYKISGGLDDMIRAINKRIPALGKQLDEAAKKSDEVIKIKPIADKLESLAEGVSKIGDTSMADGIRGIAGKIKGKTLSVDEALSLRRAYDSARKLATGGLSEAQSTKQQIYRAISDGLRNQLNNIPEVGTLNKELSTYYDALEGLATQAAKYEKEIPGISRFFPWIRTGLPGAKVKTTIARGAQELSEITKIPVNTISVLFKSMRAGLLKKLLESAKE